MVTNRTRWLCLSLGLILPLLLAPQARAAKDGFLSLIALDVIDLNIDVDSTLDIAGETRFFSSRHNRYVGGRIVMHSGVDPDRIFTVGSFAGWVWGRSSFLLNWEEPGLRSFEPLESSISTVAIPFGMDFNLTLGGVLTVSPYVSARLMWLTMKLEIGDEDFKGSSFKLGLDAGVKAAVQLGSVRLAAGIGWTHILNDEIEFEVEDLTFDSQTSGSSPEVFVGVEL